MAGLLFIVGTFGYLSAPQAEASSTLIIAKVNPGTQASYIYATCLWHGLNEPCPNANPDGSRQALDWSNAHGATVYLRTWGYRSSGWGLAYRAQKDYAASPYCRRVFAEIRKVAGGVVGTEYYNHTKLSGSAALLSVYGDGNYEFSAFVVGTTVKPYDPNDQGNSDLYTCTSTAAHLHQGATTNATRNTSRYTVTYTNTTINTLSDWQHEWYWTE